MKKKKEYVKICPKCKSIDIEMDRTNPLQPSFGLNPLYVCKNCNHSDYTFPEIPTSEIESFEEEIKKEGLIDKNPDKTPKVDTRYGNFEVRVLWKLSGPITLITGLVIMIKKPIIGLIFIILGLIMSYITYFKKRKLKD